MNETPYIRLQHLVNWSKTSEMREVRILKEDLFWIAEELSKWEFVKAEDFELAQPLDADLINDQITESHAYHAEERE